MTLNPAYELAQTFIGTWEWKDGSNPVIDRMFDDVGHPTLNDNTAWCAAYVGAMLKRAGMAHTGKLTARSYLDWGTPTDNPRPGDLVVFWRGKPDSWQGHVGFFVEFTPSGDIRVLGGNQNNQVNISTYKKNRLLGYRSPPNSLPPRPVDTSPDDNYSRKDDDMSATKLINLPWLQLARKVRNGGWVAGLVFLLSYVLPQETIDLMGPHLEAFIMAFGGIIAAYFTAGRDTDPK